MKISPLKYQIHKNKSLKRSQDFYTENCKTLLRKTKEDQNK